MPIAGSTAAPLSAAQQPRAQCAGHRLQQREGNKPCGAHPNVSNTRPMAATGRRLLRPLHRAYFRPARLARSPLPNARGFRPWCRGVRVTTGLSHPKCSSGMSALHAGALGPSLLRPLESGMFPAGPSSVPVMIGFFPAFATSFAWCVRQAAGRRGFSYS